MRNIKLIEAKSTRNFIYVSIFDDAVRSTRNIFRPIRRTHCQLSRAVFCLHAVKTKIFHERYHASKLAIMMFCRRKKSVKLSRLISLESRLMPPRRETRRYIRYISLTINRSPLLEIY